MAEVHRVIVAERVGEFRKGFGAACGLAPQLVGHAPRA